MSLTSKKVKLGKGMNVQFDKNGNFAALIERTNSKIRQKKIVPLAKRPGSYRRNEFIDMYAGGSAAPQQVISNQVNVQQVQNAPPAIQKIKCSYCGAELENEAKFCPNCGAAR